jgi:hypothetical protein
MCDVIQLAGSWLRNTGVGAKTMIRADRRGGVSTC